MSTDSGIRVNFSEQEASSESRSFDPLPSGKYHAKVTDVELRECGPTSANPGKPYYALEFTIQDGQYADRKVWTNAMLFEGALYTITWLCKATGHEDAIESGQIPGADDFVGEDVYVNVKKQVDTYKMEKEGSDEKLFKNEVKGIMKWDGQESPSGTSASSGSSGGSLLP